MFALVLGILAAALAYAPKGQSVDEPRNPLLDSLLDSGVALGPDLWAKLPPPTMPDGVGAAEQREIIAAVIRDDYSYEGDFAPGGVQLQAWSPAGRLSRLAVGDGELSSGAEMITWTKRLETDGTLLKFEVCNGESATWGVFGDEMKITSAVSYPDLNAYDTKVSASNSCITFGANRVDALAIMQVRKYRADGEVLVDNTPRILYLAEE